METPSGIQNTVIINEAAKSFDVDEKTLERIVEKLNCDIDVAIQNHIKKGVTI